MYPPEVKTHRLSAGQKLQNENKRFITNENIFVLCHFIIIGINCEVDQAQQNTPVEN